MKLQAELVDFFNSFPMARRLVWNKAVQFVSIMSLPVRDYSETVWSNQSCLNTETVTEFNKHVNVNATLFAFHDVQWSPAIELPQQSSDNLEKS